MSTVACRCDELLASDRTGCLGLSNFLGMLSDCQASSGPHNQAPTNFLGMLSSCQAPSGPHNQAPTSFLGMLSGCQASSGRQAK